MCASSAYGPKASSESYFRYLRELGMVIGGHTAFYNIQRTSIDCTRPWMIEIGSNVQITEGVTILTHGYDHSVLKGKYGDVFSSAGRVKIGDNVFIGMNSTILKGVTIGDNVVIGACSLINKDVPSDCVVVGNPQRVVYSIDDYLEKRRSAQLEEATDLYRCWVRNSPEGKRGGVPPKEVFLGFAWLFEDGQPGSLGCEEYGRVMELCGTREKSEARFRETGRAFGEYGEFLAWLDGPREELSRPR